MNKIIKEIYNNIKKYDKIFIARHIGPDPDALSSQLALKDVIINTFPKKKVFAIGNPAARFRYLGELDRIGDEDLSDALLIVVDLPNKSRIDGANPDLFAKRIKIDHHPFMEKFCDIEWIDDTASSASQMIVELILNTKLKLTKKAAENLYLGIVADTNRFMFDYTTSKTFELVSELIKRTNINFTSLYQTMYLRPIKEIKFEHYILNNLIITENGLAYAYLTDEIMKEYEVDVATAGNMVNNFNYIEDFKVWALFSEDKNNNNIRGSIRSRGPIINDVAALFGGGGHIYASGVRLKNADEIPLLVEELDKKCKEYSNNLKNKI